MINPYPKLTKWTLPSYYWGKEWYGWYPIVSRHRDSNTLDNHNFDVIWERLQAFQKDLSPEQDDPKDPAYESIQIVHETHWLCGWVEWIAIHESNEEALLVADDLKCELENYPILNEEEYDVIDHV